LYVVKHTICHVALYTVLLSALGTLMEYGLLSRLIVDVVCICRLVSDLRISVEWYLVCDASGRAANILIPVTAFKSVFDVQKNVSSH